MIGLTLKYDFDPPDADDRCYDPDIERAGFKHDALLDMQFQKRLDIAAPGLREAVGIPADAIQRIAQGLAAGFSETEHPAIEQARHAAAADTGKSIFTRLFGQEIDDFDTVRGANAGIAKSPHDLEPGNHAGNPVETSPGRNGVAVRADRDHTKRGIGALKTADQVAGGVDPHGQPGFGKFPRQPGAAFEKQSGK
jgi:hypothetical protein